MSNGESGRILRVRELFLPWIEYPNRDNDQLLSWISPYGLASIDIEEEPYIWVLRAIPRGPQRPQWERVLASSVAQLLSRTSEVLNTENGVAAVYNLLGLASHVRGRDYLPAPLLALLRGKKLDSLRHELIPLNSMLLSALIFNQRDNTLQPIWELIVKGTPDPTLDGKPSDGLEGLIYMPPSEAERGSPAVDAIGFGLTEFIKSLEKHQQRVGILRSWFDRIKNRYIDFNWDFQFFDLAATGKWPDWVYFALPQGWIDLSETKYAVWEPVALVMEEFGAENYGFYREGRALVIDVPNEHVVAFKEVRRVAEMHRCAITLSVHGSARATLSTICEVLKSFFRQKNLPHAVEKVNSVQMRNANKVFSLATAGS